MPLPKQMWAMALSTPGGDLVLTELPVPTPRIHEILVRVLACGVCRTDLHVVDGDLPAVRSGIVPGHEIVGRVVATGSRHIPFHIGDRIGIPWLGKACGHCKFCLNQQENLCDKPVFTGYHCHGGFMQYAVADARFCFAIPDTYEDANAAPLLCAGLIGYRAYRLSGTGKSRRIGIYGFGAAAHILCQIAVGQGDSVYAFVREGDSKGQEFAMQLGATWAGPSNTLPDQKLDAAIIFAPVGDLIPAALLSIRKGGSVVCAGIHMSKIPAFDYSLLWGERILRSVANLTRSDGLDFFSLIRHQPIKTTVHTFQLTHANEAIAAVRSGSLNGAAVLLP